jgi:excisionase family DNA binding protein
MEDLEKAAAYAIAEAKARGLAEIGPDELLRGCLQVVSRFGVVSLGAVVLDLEALGILWMQTREPAGAGKVAYSQAVVRLFDLGAKIAKADGRASMGVEHLLVAFAEEDMGLMAELKRTHSLTSASWRAALANFAEWSDKTVMEAAAPAKKAAGDLSGREYLTPEEAAEAIGIHVQTLRGYVRSGKLPALRLAGERAIRIRRRDLEAVLEPLVPQSMSGLAQN